MGTDTIDELEPRKENGDHAPQFSDDEPLTDPDVRVSNWDRVFRMLKKITDKVNSIDQRVAGIERKLEEKSK